MTDEHIHPNDESMSRDELFPILEQIDEAMHILRKVRDHVHKLRFPVDQNKLISHTHELSRHYKPLQRNGIFTVDGLRQYINWEYIKMSIAQHGMTAGFTPLLKLKGIGRDRALDILEGLFVLDEKNEPEGE